MSEQKNNIDFLISFADKGTFDNCGENEKNVTSEDMELVKVVIDILFNYCSKELSEEEKKKILKRENSNDSIDTDEDSQNEFKNKIAYIQEKLSNNVKDISEQRLFDSFIEWWEEVATVDIPVLPLDMGWGILITLSFISIIGFHPDVKDGFNKMNEGIRGIKNNLWIKHCDRIMNRNNRKRGFTNEIISSSGYNNTLKKVLYVFSKMGIIKGSISNYYLNNFIESFNGKLLAKWNNSSLSIYDKNKNTIYKNDTKHYLSLFENDLDRIILKSLKNGLVNRVNNIKKKENLINDLSKRLEGTSYFIHNNKVYNKYDKHSICEIDDKFMKFRTGGKRCNRNRCNVQYDYNNFDNNYLYSKIVKHEDEVRRKRKTDQYKEKLLKAVNLKKKTVYGTIGELFHKGIKDDNNEFDLENLEIDELDLEDLENNTISKKPILKFKSTSDKDVTINSYEDKTNYFSKENTFYYNHKSGVIYFYDEDKKLIQVGKSSGNVLKLYDGIEINRVFSNKFKISNEYVIDNETDIVKRLKEWYKTYSKYKKNDKKFLESLASTNKELQNNISLNNSEISQLII